MTRAQKCGVSLRFVLSSSPIDEDRRTRGLHLSAMIRVEVVFSLAVIRAEVVFSSAIYQLL